MSARALFVTSNGFGLGHVTRCMAIARRLPGDVQPIVLTLSEALPLVREQGFLAEYFASRDPGTESATQWNGRLARRIGAAFGEYDPGVVVFDGVYPYPGMLDALRGERRAKVWCRRGMWRAGEGGLGPMYEHEFDIVLEPGELATERDRGATAESRARTVVVDPILLLDEDELPSREEAAAEVGVDPDRVNVVMQPAWDNEVFGPTADRCLDALARFGDVRVLVAVSPLRSRAVPLPETVARVSTYPLPRVYRAFDLAISSAGYNVFHELVALGVPSLFVPNAGTPRDDQVARARFAEEVGVGRNWESRSAPDLEGHLHTLLDAREREAMRLRARELRTPNGAAEAASLIAAAAHARSVESPAGAR